MNKSVVGKIQLNTFDDLVGGEGTAITEVPLSELHTFRDHPFQVLDDEKMDETVESIKQYGVLMPGIVRPRDDGGYEIIAGHRRKRACELAGLETMPVVIKDMTDDEAVVAMVDSNIQREDILPSEKAHAYRMKFDVMKHQGSAGGNTLEEIGEAAGECGRTVQRYIALSYLTDSEQKWIEIFISEFKVVISPGKAAKIKMYSVNKELTEALLREILISDDPKPVKVVLKADILSEYFPDEMPAETIEEFIIRLLDEWKEKGGQ